jgi:hypothetical protein
MAIHPNIVDLRYVFVPHRAALVPNQRPRANVFPKSELGTDGDSIESKKKAPAAGGGLRKKELEIRRLLTRFLSLALLLAAVESGVGL